MQGLPSDGSDSSGDATEPFASVGSDFHEDLVQIKMDDHKPSIVRTLLHLARSIVLLFNLPLILL